MRHWVVWLDDIEINYISRAKTYRSLRVGDTHAIEVDVPTTEAESHGILMACVWFEHEGWKDSEVGEHLRKTTRADSGSFIE